MTASNDEFGSHPKGGATKARPVYLHSRAATAASTPEQIILN
jgi:hypothetical protein